MVISKKTLVVHVLALKWALLQISDIFISKVFLDDNRLSFLKTFFVKGIPK